MRALAEETKKITLISSQTSGKRCKQITMQSVNSPEKQQFKKQQQHHNNNHETKTIALPKASHANLNEELSGGIKDTIYLCNFRVSVDGEWLCLKELQDLDINQDPNAQNKKSILEDNNGISFLTTLYI